MHLLTTNYQIEEPKVFHFSLSTEQYFDIFSAYAQRHIVNKHNGRCNAAFFLNKFRYIVTPNALSQETRYCR